MRSMRRRWSVYFAAVLLGLCALMGVMWAGSYFRQLGVQMLLEPGWGGEVVVSRGKLCLFVFHFQGFYRVEKFGVICEPRGPDVFDPIDETVGISRQGNVHRLGGFWFRWEPAFVY